MEVEEAASELLWTLMKFVEWEGPQQNHYQKTDSRQLYHLCPSLEL